jgi:hypothetical protein
MLMITDLFTKKNLSLNYINRLNAYLDKHYSDVEIDFSDTCLEN